MRYSAFKTRINSYDPFNAARLGIEFYNEKIYPDLQSNYGLRSYKFHLVLEEDKPANYLPSAFKLGLDAREILEFTATCNLLDYMEDVNYSEEIKEVFPELCQQRAQSFNYEKCAKDFMGDNYEYHRRRLYRKLYGKLPVVKTTKEYRGEDEFLEFTEDSAPSWGGPWLYRDKPGCCVHVYGPTAKPFGKELDLTSSWSFYHLPHELQKNYDANEVYGWDEAKKRAEFANMDADTQIHVIKERIKWIDTEFLEGHKPFVIYAYGNDDCSYSKSFMTLEQVNQELNYLRRMQPLDFTHDIILRDWYFTN